MKKVLRATTLADRLLLLFLVTASIAGIFIAREALPSSEIVVVEVNGRAAFTASLREDRLITVQAGPGPVEIEIRHGAVRIKEAACPNKICVKEGWVSKGVIVCLPSRVVVFVGSRKADSKKEVDAVTG